MKCEGFCDTEARVFDISPWNLKPLTLTLTPTLTFDIWPWTFDLWPLTLTSNFGPKCGWRKNGEKSVPAWPWPPVTLTFDLDVDLEQQAFVCNRNYENRFINVFLVNFWSFSLYMRLYRWDVAHPVTSQHVDRWKIFAQKIQFRTYLKGSRC